MVIQQKLYTAEEFWQILDELDAEKRYELIRGEIVEMPPSSPENTIIAMLVGRFLGNHVYDNDLGFVTGADGGYTLSSREVRVPDVAFISKERSPSIPREFKGAPDLAVEVISPSKTPRSIHDKTALYLNSGARLVWNVYPEARVVEVWQATQDGGMKVHTLGIDDSLDSGEVLPGFTLPVKQIFPEQE